MALHSKNLPARQRCRSLGLGRSPWEGNGNPFPSFLPHQCSSNMGAILAYMWTPSKLILMDSEAERGGAILIGENLNGMEVTLQCQTGWDKKKCTFFWLKTNKIYTFSQLLQSCWVTARWMILKSCDFENLLSRQHLESSIWEWRFRKVTLSFFVQRKNRETSFQILVANGLGKEVDLAKSWPKL